MNDRVNVSLVTSRGSFQLNTDSRGLESWPDWFDGFDINHTWDEESGAYRGTVPGGAETLTLSLRVQGKNVSQQVSELLSILGTPGNEVSIVVAHSGGMRSVQARFIAPGSTKWYPRPHAAIFAEIPLQFESVAPEWLSVVPRRVTLSKEQLGKVVLPVAGVQPSWPKITLAGSYTSATVKLRADDDVAPVPSHAAGLVVATDPKKRGVYQADTGKIHPGSGAVFWPEMPELTASGMTIYLDVESPGTTFEAVIEYQERWAAAW